MKLSKDFIVHKNGSEALLVPVGGTAFSGIVKGNATFGEILSLLEEDTCEADLCAAMAERFDAPEETIARDVEKALSELRAIGALDE